MLQRAEQCRVRLQAYCSNWLPERGSSSGDDGDNYDLREDILSPEEWKGVNEVIKVLKPLLHFTKLVERRDTGLQDWVPIVDKLITHFYEGSQRLKSMADEGPTYEWLHICCETAWEKLNDYYQLVTMTGGMRRNTSGSPTQRSRKQTRLRNTALEIL
jgi:hypothetical protein